MTGAQLITEERREQLQRHKRTVEYDVKTNTTRDLDLAAMRLIMLVVNESFDIPSWPEHWNKDICDKMDAKTDFEKIQIAGAFLAASLDRRMAMGCLPGKAYDEFTQAARPLMEFMANYGHPHTTAIVGNSSAELLQGIAATGNVPDYIKD